MPSSVTSGRMPLAFREAGEGEGARGSKGITDGDSRGSTGVTVGLVTTRSGLLFWGGGGPSGTVTLIWANGPNPLLFWACVHDRRGRAAATT